MATPITARVVSGRQSDQALKLSFDRKVSPRGTYQAEHVGKHDRIYPGRWVPTIPNSFGLPAGESCPGKTPFCVGCYAVNAEKHPRTKALLAHNLHLLQACQSVEAMVRLLDELVLRFTREADRRGLLPAERIFRIHWSGDFYSRDYALAWALVILRHPDIQFWAFTRSFTEPINVVSLLIGLPNLALYLSVDADNQQQAELMVATYPELRCAYNATDFIAGFALAGEGASPLRCPENAGRVGLMEPDEQGNGRGACSTCRICVDGRRDVLFATAGRDDVNGPVLNVRVRPRTYDQPPERYCHNPECNSLLVPNVHGRARKWCSSRCRWRAQKLRQTAPSPASSWPLAVSEAHRLVPRQVQYTDAELLDHLRTITLFIRKAPADYDVQNFRRQSGGGPSTGPYVRAFGSLTRARELAGIPELVEDIRQYVAR